LWSKMDQWPAVHPSERPGKCWLHTRLGKVWSGVKILRSRRYFAYFWAATPNGMAPDGVHDAGSKSRTQQKKHQVQW
jgi:hypothetical protein